MTLTQKLADAPANNDPEAIFGVDLSWTECDALAWQFIRKEWQGYERLLFTSKWFDYRFMHPVHATYLYAHHWVIAYRDAFARSFDKRAAEHIKPMKHDDLFQCDKAFVAGMWRGRQHADAMCIPYDQYTRMALEAALKYWRQRNMPRPCHLYSGGVCDIVGPRWEEMQAARLFYGSHTEFRAHHYQGTDAQNAHHEWLFAQAMKRSNPYPTLSRFYNEDLLPVEKITTRFGADVMQKLN